MGTKGWVLGFVLGAVALAGCTRGDEPLPHGGETNWLRACDEDADCELGSCMCGVCSTACDVADDCAGDFAGSCVETGNGIGASACGEAVAGVAALCLPDCDEDEACGAGFACRDGACVTDEVAAHIDGSTKGDPRCAMGTLPVRCDPFYAICNFEYVERGLPACRVAAASEHRLSYYEVDCGDYRGVVEQFNDIQKTYFYGETGELAGTNEEGPNAEGCIAYTPSFRLQSCEPITPECPGDAACSHCDGAEQTLACFCTLTNCPTRAAALAGQVCPGGPHVIVRGCGLTRVAIASGEYVRVFDYEDDTGALVAGSVTGDVPQGECGWSDYRTARSNLVSCPDYSICSPCDSDTYEKCTP